MTEQPDHTARIADELVVLEKSERRWLMFAMALAVVIIAGCIMLITATPDGAVFGLLALAVFLLGSLFIGVRYAIAGQYSRKIMPILADMVGYTYDDQQMNDRDIRAKLLVPGTRLGHLQDHMSGTVAGIDLAVADIKMTVKRGKSSETVFAGLVMRFDVAAKIAPIMMRSNRKLQRGLSQIVFGADPQVEVLAQHGLENGDSILLHAVDQAPDQAQIDQAFVLFDHVQSNLDKPYRLHALRVEADAIYVSIDAKRNMFETYRMFGAREGRAAQISRALDEMRIPAQVLGALGGILK